MAQKKRILQLQGLIKKTRKSIDALMKREAKARENWRKKHRRYQKAAKEGFKVRRGTKKENKLKQIVYDWEQENKKLTIERDEARRQLRLKQEEASRLEFELSRSMEKDRAEMRAVDELVDQVFTLNDAVVEALKTRNAFLTRQVYDKLIKEDGSLRSQVTFTNSDGTRKVVAMVNSITQIRSDLAETAREEIQSFFSRFQRHAQLFDDIQALFDLTRKILVEKTKFKVGPDLYRFLSLDLNKDNFPELVRAQELLKKSLRSEKTDSYIRLWTRPDCRSKWSQVKQN